MTLLNRASRELHGLPLKSLPAGQWSEYYDLYRPDGVSPLPTEEIPLYRAFRGERIRNAEMVVAPKDLGPRTLVVNGRSIHDGDGGLLGAVVAMHDVTDQRKAEAALNRQALHDPLTNLANRLLLRDRIDHALAARLRQPAPLVLLVLDLDKFKTVNDALGHEAGDHVLATIADRLRACLRPDDTIARLGGDEFAILLENASEEHALAIASQVLTVVRSPIPIQGRSIAADASIGITVSEAAGSAEELLRNADLALRAAKTQGDGNVQVFDASMHDVVLEQLILQTELREAIDRREFVLHYQPVVSLITGHLQGFEALVRWNHPERGIIAPATFIPLAESTGLIVPLGDWVLREACLQARRWQDTHPEAGDLIMHVNVSVRQLKTGSLIDVVAGALAEAGLRPDQLELEITESVIMHRGDALTALDRLHAMGTRLAIDDFGTGYSSLSRLHLLPIDKVKIDKSFIDAITDGAPGADGRGHHSDGPQPRLADGGRGGRERRPAAVPPRPRLRRGTGLRLRETGRRPDNRRIVAPARRRTFVDNPPRRAC